MGTWAVEGGVCRVTLGPRRVPRGFRRSNPPRLIAPTAPREVEQHVQVVGSGVRGHLAVTNLSGRPCRLSGVPRMVAVDLHGRPVGPPVARSPSMPTVDGGPPIRVARLDAHGSALFTFSVGEVLDYGTHGCDYEYAAGFDVTLPGSSRPQYVPAPVRRCLHPPGGRQMAVGLIE
jgi:hypothetical protein